VEDADDDQQVLAFRTVDDAAEVARVLLAEGRPPYAVWQFAVLQLLDDYSSVLRRRGVFIT
jgi:hypothetical protein